MRLQIEISTPADNNIKTAFNSALSKESRENLTPNTNIAHTDLLVAHIQQYIPCLKVGRGGSHIWISNQANDRLAIIYLPLAPIAPKPIKDGAKKTGKGLTAQLDIDANHVLITHNATRTTATYDCALATNELCGGPNDEYHELTPDQINWLKSIEYWVDACYRSCPEPK